MPNLASNSLGQIFTIPASDWTVINRRVGVVLSETQIQTYLQQYLGGYAALLASCRLWTTNTFPGLISQSQALVGYATTAIANFSGLNTAVEGISQKEGGVPEDVQQQTTALLQKLASDTAPLAAAFAALSKEMLAFLGDMQVVDEQVAAHKDQLGTFWTPVGAYITSLENAAGLVTGEWQAITDDLNNTLASPIDVTMPFLESLNIDAAIVSWQNAQAEAAAFPAMAANQQQYWTNPFAGT